MSCARKGYYGSILVMKLVALLTKAQTLAMNNRLILFFLSSVAKNS